MKFIARYIAPLVALALLHCLPGSGPALAGPRLRALLAGVSNYPAAMVGNLQLKGPKHDVALMLETLARAGFADADMIVLADGLEDTKSPRKADGLPTRSALLAALDKLAQDSGPEDFVLVYMTGHGSQQPDLNPGKRPVPKPGGLDEVFLPIDIGKWDDGKASIENALLDFELGNAVNAIRARGASVWVVIDACHSGTMTRGAGEDSAAARQVPAAALGVPQALLDRARANSATRSTAIVAPRAHDWVVGQAAGGPTRGAGATMGSYVAFFAAWPDQVALEENLPRSIAAKVGKAPHGLLTFYLAQAMRSGRVSTFRDLAHLVLAGYGQFGAQAPTPMFEGDLAAAFPGAGTPGLHSFPVRGSGGILTIDAGVIDGVAPGAIIALADAADPATPKAYARVTSAGIASATLDLAAYAGKEATLAAVTANTQLVGSVTEPGVDLELRLARPPQSDAAPAAVTAALESLAHSKQGISLTDAGQTADITLRFASDRLWLVAEDGRFDLHGRSPTMSVYAGPGEDAAKSQGFIEAQLKALAKARLLIRVAGAMNMRALEGRLKIEAHVQHDAGTSPGSAAMEEPDQRNCGTWDVKSMPATAQQFGDLASAGLLPAAFVQCDQIYFRLSNTGTKPIDITPLYINATSGISYVGPRGAGLRLEPGDPPRLLTIRIRTRDIKTGKPQSLGLERLLFIAVEVDGRQAFASNFDYLDQPGLGSSVASRGGSADPLRALLEAAAFGGATRSASAPSGNGAAGIAQFLWNTVLPNARP